MNKNSFDLIILGAGPAGASAALCAAAEGLSVCLIDKKKFPRDKICGDALSLDVTNQLQKIPNLDWQAFSNLDERITSKGVKIYSPKGEEIEILLKGEKEKDLGHTVPRMDFDNFLVDQLRKEKNIHFIEALRSYEIKRESDSWTLSFADNELLTKLVLAADGANSSFKRQFTKQEIDRKHHAAGVRAYYDGVEGLASEGVIELHFIKDLLPGYLWIFPMQNGKANVGLGVLSSKVAKEKLNLKKLMLQILQEDPKFKDRFQNAKAQTEPKGFGLPLGAKRNAISGEGFMLLGDAASLIDPISGEGIANAIRSGRFAAAQAVKCLKENSYQAKFLKAYDKRVYDSCLKELKYSYYFQQLVKNEKLANWLLPKILKNPFVQSQLVGEFDLNKIKRSMYNPLFWLSRQK